MKVIILEDEIIATNRLIRLLKEIDADIDIVATYSSIEDTANHLQNQAHPDLLFLDIHVLDGNSMELFNIVKIDSKVIFTTAYDEYAVEAFRKNALDYLLKPLKKDQLLEAVSKAKTLLSSQVQSSKSGAYKEHFLIKFGSKVRNIETSEIAYIQSKDKISFIYTHDGAKIASDDKLQDFEKVLDPSLFFRINRQYIAAINAIDQLNQYHASRYKVSLKPSIDDQIIVSTEKNRAFKKWLHGHH